MGEKMRTMEELRTITTEIINKFGEEKLSLEEVNVVLAGVRAFMTVVHIVGNFDNLKLIVKGWEAKRKAGVGK